MNRLIVVLLIVLIILVAVHGFITWRAGEQARDAAEQAREYADHQACVDVTQATVTVALVAPALIDPPSDVRAKKARAGFVRSLSEQLDAC